MEAYSAHKEKIDRSIRIVCKYRTVCANFPKECWHCEHNHVLDFPPVYPSYFIVKERNQAETRSLE